MNSFNQYSICDAAEIQNQIFHQQQSVQPEEYEILIDHESVIRNSIDYYVLEPNQEAQSNTSHNTDSDETTIDVNTVISRNKNERKSFHGKDRKTVWSHLPPKSQKSIKKTKSSSDVQFQTLHKDAKKCANPLEIWKLYFTDEMLDLITFYTNIYIDNLTEKYSRVRDCKRIDKSELTGFMGLLYLTGLYGSTQTNLSELWAEDGTGIEYFRAIMSLKRFRFIMRCLSFDDLTTRDGRVKYDKLAPIREIFTGVVDACKKYVSPNEHVTVDAMLDGFRGKCEFRQCMPSKPARYGIKIYALVDAVSYYTLNMEVCVGDQPNGPFARSNKPADIVLRLIEPIDNTGRTVTMNSSYTSLSLIRELYMDHDLTVVGAAKKKLRELPPELTTTRGKKVNSITFLYTDYVTAVSWVLKKDKSEIYLSSMPESDQIDMKVNPPKPRILSVYNTTKKAVDVVDQMKATCSVSRPSNRWQLTTFFSLMNTVGINAYVIHQIKNDYQYQQRREFLKALALSLVNEQLQYRATTGSNLKNDLKLSMTKILGGKPVKTKQMKKAKLELAIKRGRCGYCSSKKNRKTKTKCAHCGIPICREHTVPSCTDCVKKTEYNTSSSDEY